MIAFTYFYGLGKDSMIHRAFTSGCLAICLPELYADVDQQPCLPTLGCPSYHVLCLPPYVHVHRGKKQLLSRDHPSSQVREILPSSEHS